MAELETALRQLGHEVAFPPTPDLAPAIRGRLERPQRFWRRPAAIALAVLVVAASQLCSRCRSRARRSSTGSACGTSASSVSRSCRWCLPRDDSTSGAGSPSTRPSAARRGSFPDSEPDSVWLNESLPGGKVSLLWGTPSNVRLLLAEVTGRAYIEKIIGGDSQVERVDIGSAGAWFQGPHVVMFQDRDGRFHDSQARLAGSTLVWQDGDVTLRLEGRLTEAEALRIARTAS